MALIALKFIWSDVLWRYSTLPLMPSERLSPERYVSEKLSGGVKTLILINNDSDHIFNASACGDNCAKWLLKIGEKKDITIRLGYLMDFGEGSFDIKVLNTGRIVHSIDELDDEVIGKRLLHGEAR